MMATWRSSCLARGGASLTRNGTRSRLSWLSSVASDRRGFATGQGLHRPQSRSYNGLRSLLRVSDEVAEAVATNKPVVALESTIYTHGALGEDLHLERIVRDNGGIPAICGVFKGVPTVGLTYDNEIKQMMREGAQKVSRRDLAFLVGMGLGGGAKMHGGTTIAATMILAHLAGVRVFGTGGLGGVHQGGENSMDISADLTELGKTRVAVVSSGCKGFLDIPRTLEFLETQGVVVSTFRQGRKGQIDFPAFWARESGLPSPSVVDTARQAAATIYAQEQLGLESGLLFANPVPESVAIPRADMEGVIKRAVREAAEQGHTGSKNTPFILGKITEYTDGNSTKANIKLVQDNVKMATKVAVELSKFLEEPPSGRTTHSRPAKGPSSTRDSPYVAVNGKVDGRECQSSEREPVVETAVPTNLHVTKPAPASARAPAKAEANIVVAGAVALDLSCDYNAGASGAETGESASPKLHTSNPATIHQSVGGVGHNVALAAHRIAGPDTVVKLFSLVGNDIAGETILSTVNRYGLDASAVQRSPHRTAQYVSVNDGGKNLVLAMADMDILSSSSRSAAEFARDHLANSKPGIVVVDGNWDQEGVRALLQGASQARATRIFEPVSVAKSERVFPPLSSSHEPTPNNTYPDHHVDLATPNVHELRAMYETAARREYFEQPSWFGFIDALDIGAGGARDRFVRVSSAAITDEGVPQQCLQLLPFIPTLVVTMGDKGVLLAEVLKPEDPRIKDPDHARYMVARTQQAHPAIGAVYMRLYPAIEKVRNVVSVNGVGDTFLGALVAGLEKGGRIDRLIDVAQKAAVLTLRSPQSVSRKLGTLAPELRLAANPSSPPEPTTTEDSSEPESQDRPSVEQPTHDKPPAARGPTLLAGSENRWGELVLPPIPPPPPKQQQPSGSTDKRPGSERFYNLTEKQWGEPSGLAPVVRDRPFRPKKPVVAAEERKAGAGEEEKWGGFAAGKRS